MKASKAEIGKAQAEASRIRERFQINPVDRSGLGKDSQAAETGLRKLGLGDTLNAESSQIETNTQEVVDGFWDFALGCRATQILHDECQEELKAFAGSRGGQSTTADIVVSVPKKPKKVQKSSTTPVKMSTRLDKGETIVVVGAVVVFCLPAMYWLTKALGE